MSSADLKEQAESQAAERLIGAVVDPSAPLAGGWNGSVLEQFQKHVARQPEALSAISTTAALTYAEFDVESDLLAERAREFLDQQPSRLLSIYSDRSPRLTIALLAALKSGCAFHIIDPKYPRRRIAEYPNYARPAGILNAAEDFRAKELFSDFLKPRGSGFWLDSTRLLNGTSPTSKMNRHLAAPSIHSSSRMYVAFTSGTTGVPKAVWGNHGPVSHFFHWQCETFEISAADRVSVLSGLAHDPLLRDVLMPLWAGCAACFPPDDVYKVPGALYSWLRDAGITLMHLTPSLCHLLLNIPQSELTPCLPRIRLAFFGGEPLMPRLVDRFQAIAPNATVVNCYGATETPQVMSVYHIKARSSNEVVSRLEDNSPVPIGQGIEGVQLLVLNGGNHLCDSGETGEICVRTPHRAAKVEDISGRSSVSVIPNPFSNDPEDLLYRTGDYGRYQPDGNVMLLGRRDQQMKVRGFRVDLSEIERVLEQSENINRYVVEAAPRGQDHSLALFIVPKQNSAFDVEAFRSQLLEWLPAFMVPERIVCLASLPQTPNGKVDRQMLRQMLNEKSTLETEILSDPIPASGVTSVTAIEQKLRTMAIGDQQGGLMPMDSLRLVEVACLIENQFKVRLPIGDLLEHQNTFALAAQIARLQERSALREGEPAEIPEEPRPELAEPNFRFESGRKNPPLLPSHERLSRAILNRIMQIVARMAPDAIRVRLHRWRGIQLGYNVSIGYDTVIETAFPWLVRIGDHTNIGMRVTIIGHFRGMEHAAADGPTVIIEDYAFVGPGVIILPNVRIGTGAVVAAGSIVSASIPANCFAQGNPARVVARCGVPLSGSASYSEFLSRLVPLSPDQKVTTVTTSNLDGNHF